MTNEAYYHGAIDFSPLDATVENFEHIYQYIVDIFGEGDDTFYVDFEEDSIIFEGYSEPDDDEFKKHVNEVSECLQRHGSHITECDLEINDGFSKVGKVIIWNGEVVFLDTEAAAIHDATDTELLNELKRRGKDLDEIRDKMERLPSAQPEQRYTEEELSIFAHGISLSLLSKRSAQHWRYDEDTATEIKFLERLYEKVVADMRGEQDGR